MELNWRSGIIGRANRYTIPNKSSGWIDDAHKIWANQGIGPKQTLKMSINFKAKD